MKNAAYTHAGGVVYRLNDGEPEFFIITGKPNQSHWLLPRGHIEASEIPEETALRELTEETGLEGRIIADLGVTRYTRKGERVRIKFFLIEKNGGDEETAPEGRLWRWCRFREAFRLVSFRNYRTQLKLARRLLSPRSGSR